MALVVPPTVVLVLATAPLVLPTVVLVPLAPPTVVLVMLALLTVALSPEYVPVDTRARRSELQQEQERKTKTQ